MRTVNASSSPRNALSADDVDRRPEPDVDIARGVARLLRADEAARAAPQAALLPRAAHDGILRLQPRDFRVVVVELGFRLRGLALRLAGALRRVARLDLAGDRRCGAGNRAARS